MSTGRSVTTMALTLIVALFGGRAVALAAHPLEGKAAPPIKLKTANGQLVSLDQVKAQVIVLDFWATWCPPCRKGLPLLQGFQNWAKQEKRSIAVLTVNLRETPDKVRAFFNKERLTMTALMDMDGSTAQAYGVEGIPQTVVIHNGKVAHVHVGYSPNLAQTLKAQAKRLLEQDKS